MRRLRSLRCILRALSPMKDSSTSISAPSFPPRIHASGWGLLRLHAFPASSDSPGITSRAAEAEGLNKRSGAKRFGASADSTLHATSVRFFLCTDHALFPRLGGDVCICG